MHAFRRLLPSLLVATALVPIAGAFAPLRAQEPLKPPVPESIIHKIVNAAERMQMTVNTSRILTLDEKIPQAQVNNPDILDLTPLSPNEIQVSAKVPGVTQINLWDANKKLYTIDVIVYADVQELALLLKSQFPNTSLRVVPVATGVLISGYVDKPEQIDLILRIAAEFYPRVINNMTVSGVQQVLLHVRVMEVSRTKLRTLGFDFVKITGSNIIHSGISGLLNLTAAEIGTGGASIETEIGGAPTFDFSVVRSGSAFFGVLDALRQDNLMKILAEPTLVTMSGQPASFLVGGEFTILPQGLAAGEPRDIRFGTTVDFVPIVLGDGRIRLEVRPEVSEIDDSLTVNGIPGRRSRTIDTTVEMQAGQTLAIAGLVQSRTEAENRGLPLVSEVPYLGVFFRRVRERTNEVELLILVTPELVDPMDAHEVPQCGPGLMTTSPSDCELYLQGHLEVPNCCPPCGAAGGAPPCTQNGGAPHPGVIPSSEEPVYQQEQAQPVPPAAGASARPDRIPAANVRASNLDGRRSPQNRSIPQKPQALSANTKSGDEMAPPKFIGPVGYDVLN